MSLASDAGGSLVANDKGAFGQPRQCGIDVLQAFDDQRSGRSSLYLAFGEAMRVGMVPVESWGFILRDLYVVIEALAGLDQRVDNFILSADGRRIGPVEMDIGCGRRHRSIAGTAAAGGRRRGEAHLHAGHSALALEAEAAGRSFWK